MSASPWVPWSPVGSSGGTRSPARGASCCRSRSSSCLNVVPPRRRPRAAARAGRPTPRRTRRSHALAEARQTPTVIRTGSACSGRNRVLLRHRARRGVLVDRHDHLRVLHADPARGVGRRRGAPARSWARSPPPAGPVQPRRRARRHARPALGVTRTAILGRVLNGLGAVVMGLVTGPAGLIAAYLFTYSMHGMNGPPHAALLPARRRQETAPPCSRSTR